MKDVNLNFDLTEEQKEKILVLFEKVQIKFERMGKGDAEYFEGVVDGINHCMKMIQGIKDDYLDGVK